MPHATVVMSILVGSALSLRISCEVPPVPPPAESRPSGPGRWGTDQFQGRPPVMARKSDTSSSAPSTHPGAPAPSPVTLICSTNSPRSSTTSETPAMALACTSSSPPETAARPCRRRRPARRGAACARSSARWSPRTRSNKPTSPSASTAGRRADNGNRTRDAPRRTTMSRPGPPQGGPPPGQAACGGGDVGWRRWSC